MPYHVSRARTPRGDQYTAWHGLLLREAGLGYWPEMLGIYSTAQAARAACEAHLADNGRLSA